MKKVNRQQFPAGWVSAYIEDIFAPLEDGRTLHQGWSPQCEKAARSSSDDWGVLKTTAIQAGAFLPEHNKRLPGGLTPRPQIEVKQGDILITCAGPRSRCGIAALVRSTPPKLLMSGKMYRFRVHEEFFDARFLEAFLQTSAAYDSIDRMKTGGSDSGLNLTHDRFRQLEVPVAPLNEQRRIVEIYEELISDIDAGVAALVRVREKLKLYRASVFKAAVEGALTTEWRAQHPLAEPANELLKRMLVERRRRWEEDQLRTFKEKGQDPPKNWKAKYKEPAPPATTLPPLPGGWCWASIDQLSSQVRNGHSLKPNVTYGVPILRISAVRAFALDLEDVRYLSGAPSDYVVSLIEPRDLLFTRYNGTRSLVGVCAIVPDINKAIVHPDKLIRARPLPIVAVPAFIALAANVGASRQFIEQRIRTTAGQAGVSGSDVKELPVPLPPSLEQEVISETVEDQLSIIDHLEADLDAKLKSAQGLRQATLRHAFTGKLVRQDPNDEPASKLLKRIAAEREARARGAAAAKRPKKNTNNLRLGRRRWQGKG